MVNEASMDNDPEFIKYLNEENPKAFKKVYESFNSPLFTFANNITGNPEESEDIVQESFIKLFHKCSHFQTLTNIQAFLYITTKNACLDWLRRQKTATKRWGKKIELSNDVHFYDITDSDMADIQTEVVAKLLAEADALPTKCQRIFKMYIYNNKKVTEIASELGISKATVSEQITIAIRKLRSAITVLILALLISFFIK